MSYLEDDLVYAAYNRCYCGAGLAYVKSLRAHREWHCSDVLLGRANRQVKHTEPLSYQRAGILAENQPNANRATTRPKATLKKER